MINSYSQLRASEHDHDYFSGEEKEISLSERLAFVEGEHFQAVIGAVIGLNIIVLWGETDAPDWAIWPPCDHLFLVIFIVELAMKCIHHGAVEYFTGTERNWALIDATIIIFGVGDLWVAPVVMPSYNSKSTFASVLRIMRLMRLLRLVRVFKIFGELRRFLEALQVMGPQFIWIFLVLTMFLVCVAIITTHALGHGDGLGGRHTLEKEHADAFEHITGDFGTVGTSIFTLFQITTTDNWDLIAAPIISIDTRWRLFFYAFIVFASWTMISVLTAVASNSMIEATSDRKEKELEELEKKHLIFLEFLRTTFLEADADGNGMLDKEEFVAMMNQDFVHERMRQLDFHLSEDEWMQAWDMLDVDESGELTIDEFVTGLACLQEGLATKHIVNADYALKRAAIQIESKLSLVRKAMTEVMEQNEEILHRLKKQNQSHGKQQKTLILWQKWAINSPLNGYVQAKMPDAWFGRG